MPGYFVWEIPGKPVAVHLHLDVVDRMAAEVMRGFGAIPKRGAEVGGVLLGTVDHGGEAGQTIVRVEDFEPVACEYRRGPSYLFTDEERAAFADAVARWEPDAARPAYAVGYFRSHTRDGMSLAEEDVELMDEFFPAPDHIALLVKPFATKVSQAGFFVRENGVFPEEAPLEFPFRRREMTGEEPPPRRSLYERRPRGREAPRTLGPTPVQQADADTGDEEPYYPSPEPVFEPQPAYATTAPSRARRRGWVWIPLSFIFLLLGVVLGFQAALTLAPQLSANREVPDLALNLTASRTGGSLTIRWNRDSVAVRNAQSAVLDIEDGGLSKSVDLGTADLRNGTVIYQNSSNAVRFRLVVFINERLTMSETLDWAQ